MQKKCHLEEQDVADLQLADVKEDIKYEGKLINLGKDNPNNIIPEYIC